MENINYGKSADYVGKRILGFSSMFSLLDTKQNKIQTPSQNSYFVSRMFQPRHYSHSDHLRAGWRSRSSSFCFPQSAQFPGETQGNACQGLTICRGEGGGHRRLYKAVGVVPPGPPPWAEPFKAIGGVPEAQPPPYAP